MGKKPHNPFTSLIRNSPKFRVSGTSKLSAEEIETLEADARSHLFEEAAADDPNTPAMHSVASKLSTITADTNFSGDEAKHALKWLADNPTDFLKFLRSGYWTSKGGLQPTLPRLKMMARERTIGPLNARINGMVYRDAIYAVIQALKGAHSTMDITEERSIDLRRRVAEAFINHLEHLYKEYGSNPVFAWEAYAVGRQTDIPHPKWVLEYLDDCAKGLSAWLKDKLDRKKARQGETSIKDPGAEKRLSDKWVAGAAAVYRDQLVFAKLHPAIGPKGGWPKEKLKELRDEIGITHHKQMMKIYDDFRKKVGLPDRPPADKSAARKSASRNRKPKA